MEITMSEQLFVWRTRVPPPTTFPHWPERFTGLLVEGKQIMSTPAPALHHHYTINSREGRILEAHRLNFPKQVYRLTLEEATKLNE